MRSKILVLFILLLNGCHENEVSISSSLSNKNEEKYTLTFKYSEEENKILKEVEQTEKYTFSYQYEKDHLITKEEYDLVYEDVNKEIPNNQGGYYSFGDFYCDLNMNQDNKFKIGFQVDSNYTFYYTIIGGEATPPTPTGTLKLNIEDSNNYIYDKPDDNESYFYPGEIITLHSFPIMDADLSMYINDEFYSIQNCILIEEKFIWEYSFEMPNRESIVSFRVTY